uniref:protein ASPARTIC PROTEASE IN GUARD CELL 1-like n=1 Tax=Erigeron canadensis TaxID=72917 RepID=UPI001CB922ED|nr:protein ASPARTIC PROTEASE IN GUARD CELL 1-like [Erigeron canadensis]
MTKLGFYFISILLSLSLPSLHSHTLSTTSQLDISKSILNTLNVITAISNPVKENESKTTSFSENISPSSSFLSLQLHPRATVHKSTHQNYESLTLSRLARDSARVKAIQTKVNLAVNGFTKTDLKPYDINDDVNTHEELQVPVISGAGQGSGEYFCRIGIGHPPSQVYMVLDTGSDVNWLQCAPCADCYQQADPIFEPATSSSYSPLTCDARECKSLDVSECRNNTCLYEVSYGDGSYTVGDFVTETVTFSQGNVIKNIAIGCGHNNEGLFVGAAGLLGLGGGPLSFPSQINATSYSYCLVDRDSDVASTIEFNLEPLLKESVNVIKAPLLSNNKLSTFYYIGLRGMSVSGKMVHIPSSVFKLTNDGDGGVIVDSGTAITRLRKDAYNALRDAFVGKLSKDMVKVDGVALFDTCFDLGKKKSVQVPTVSFHFSNGKVLDLAAKNYMIPVDSNGTFCFAFAPTLGSLSIIGNVQQQGTRVSYDLENKLIGFSPNEC